MSFHLRPATSEDRYMLFEWRNDPWIVQLSTSQKTVTWEEHTVWFNKIMTENDHLLFIIAKSETGMGSVRLDRTAEDATITIYLLQSFVGQGYGSKALRHACALAFERWPDLRCIRAFIRQENLPSRRAFAKVDFKEVPTNTGSQKPIVEMILMRSRTNHS